MQARMNYFSVKINSGESSNLGRIMRLRVWSNISEVPVFRWAGIMLKDDRVMQLRINFRKIFYEKSLARDFE